jgi:hypothetical protein
MDIESFFAAQGELKGNFINFCFTALCFDELNYASMDIWDVYLSSPFMVS